MGGTGANQKSVQEWRNPDDNDSAALGLAVVEPERLFFTAFLQSCKQSLQKRRAEARAQT